MVHHIILHTSLYHFNTGLESPGVSSYPGLMRSPLSGPDPETDRSAPECPTLGCCGADTSALRRQGGTRKDRKKNRQSGDVNKQRTGGQSQLRAFGNKLKERSEKRESKYEWKSKRKQTGINERGDRLPELRRGRKKSGTAESDVLSEDEMPSLLNQQGNPV